MESKLYPDQSPEKIIDLLEAENYAVEENYQFLKLFDDTELGELEREFLDLTKEMVHLQNRRDELLAPILDQLKILKKKTGNISKDLAAGGRRVTEKVYCFPDYQNNMMGLYDDAGQLVAMRPMFWSEQQLHINSSIHMTKTSKK